MARPVPIGEYEEQVPVEEGLRRIIPEMRPGTVGEAISNLGGSVEKVAQSQAAGYVGTTMAKLRLAAEQHLIDSGNKSQDDLAKAGGFTPSVMSDYQKSADSALEGAPNSIAKRLMQHGIAQVGQELTGRAMHIEAVARVAQSKNDAQTAIEHAASAVELNPSSWKDAGAEQIHSIRTLNVDPVTATELQRDANQKIGLAAGRGYAKADPLGTLKRLDDPNDELLGGLSTEARAHVQQYARSQFAEQKAAGIVGQYSGQGVRAGAAALTAMEKDQSIPVDLKDAVRDQVNRQVDALRTQRREQYADSVAAMEERIGTKRADASDIPKAQALFDKGVASPLEYASWRRGIAESMDAGADDFANFKAAKDAYAKGIHLDPEKKDHREGVSQLFDAITSNTKPGSPDYVNRAVDLTEHLGVVPKSGMDWARVALVSGSPQEAAAAADMVSRINEVNPRALGFGYEKEIALSSAISGAVRSGGDATVAVNNARQLGQMPKVDTEEFKRAWRAQDADAGQAGALHAALSSNQLFKPGMFSSVPRIPAPMQADYDESTKRYFQLSGNLKEARDLAARDVQRVWGVSEVNGGREIMQYPPESYGFTASDIRTHLAGLLKDRAEHFNTFSLAEGKVAPAKGLDADMVQLTPAEGEYSTARSQGRYWHLTAPDEHGFMQTIFDTDGKPLVYALPGRAADFERIRADTHAAAVAQAREYREFMQREEIPQGP